MLPNPFILVTQPVIVVSPVLVESRKLRLAVFVRFKYTCIAHSRYIELTLYAAGITYMDRRVKEILCL